MGIAILPYDMKNRRCLADIPLEELHWPLEEVRTEGTVADLTGDDHLILSPSSRRMYFPSEKLNCRLSMRITEPYAVHRRHYLAMYLLWPRFYRVFTRCKKLAGRIPNARALTLTTSWIENPDAVDATKTRRMSLIASSKRQLEGRRLRHDTASWINETGADVDLLGRAYRPIEQKEEGLAPYQFSVVIENCREPGYFTEKLNDCLVCNTVPIYWGAPDIGDFFDLRGFVVCRNASDVKQAVEALDEQDYTRLSVYAEENRQRALDYSRQERHLAETIAREAA